MNSRIDFIDLAKGFCIILVVFYHINDYFELSNPLMPFLNAFRMPLYFFLSGLFFKQYEGFAGFLKRKVNKLLIPFLFFYLTTSVLLPHILFWIGYEVRNLDALGWHSLIIFLDPPHQVFSNFPIWFLICLFDVNLLFYGIFLLSSKLNRFNVLCICILSLIVGIGGYSLGKSNIDLPMYIDSAMTALPFFVCGFVIRKFTLFLYPNKSDKFLLLWISICAVSLYFSKVFFEGSFSFGSNRYSVSFVGLYLSGLIGTMMVLFLAKFLHKLPLVSYWGRYSIIILCTHNPVIQFLLIFVRKIPVGEWWQVSITLVITMLLYLGIIPLFIKFLPYVTAQKDVIKIDNSSNK